MDSEPITLQRRPPPSATHPTTVMSVSGMTCQNCARHVREALLGVPGVTGATVDLVAASATVRWSPESTPNPAAACAAVTKAGYPAQPLSVGSVRLEIEGMTCQGCARSVGEALRKVPGVSHVEVQLEKNQAVVEGLSQSPDVLRRLVEAVTAAGFKASPTASPDLPPKPSFSPLQGWRFNVIVGPILTAPLLIAEWVFGLGMERWYHWLAFALVLPIQTLCGARFYRGAWNQLKVGRSNMDALVVLGSTTAFLYSTWGLLANWHTHLFFMESASIITLISVGHWVETKVSARAEASLRALMNLVPPQALVLLDSGEERVLSAAEIQPGQRVILKPGDRVPADAIVDDGSSDVDESMLTGESLPVSKTIGSPVFGGTLNIQGRLVARVNATGERTALAGIINLVRRAQSSRADIQKLGDQVSNVFVPIVVAIALATGFWWALAPDSARMVSDWLGGFLWASHHPEGPLAAAVYHAAAVLIIACPCAMGLATPIAIMAGTNAASERGILIRDGAALEKTGDITSVLFDKTGTLTQGKISVAATVNLPGPGASNDDFLPIAAALARASKHPLSQAIGATSDHSADLAEWSEVRGSGIQAVLKQGTHALAGRTLRLGSLTWLTSTGVDLAPAGKFQEEWSDRGASISGLAADGHLLTLIALRDVVKPNAAEVVASLRQSGLKIAMLTGDNRRTALALAAQVGIAPEDVHAEIRPEGKVEIVRLLQQRGQRVAFVGDGINDAPALEQADLGIAVSRASDVAREAADVILLNSDIQAVPEALALAQATLRTIRQNLFWAFFYNAAGIPLAMFGFLSPFISALAMGFSDLIVIGNALRLRRWKHRSARVHQGR